METETDILNGNENQTIHLFQKFTKTMDLIINYFEVYSIEQSHIEFPLPNK